MLDFVRMIGRLDKQTRRLVLHAIWGTVLIPFMTGPAEAQVVTEFSAGASGGPIVDITTGADGNLWFTEFDGNRIGRITPAGAVDEFSSGLTPQAGPLNIVTGPDGNLWFAENLVNRIGRITPGG